MHEPHPIRSAGPACSPGHPHLAAALSLLVLTGLVGGCEEPPPQLPTYGAVNISSKLEAADGLDLRAVGDIVKSAKDAAQFEQLLNKEGGINNLDLDDDGKVDFIKVTEYGDDTTKGFSLTVEPAKDEVQEIATIEIEKKKGAEEVDVHVSGNQQVYGHHHNYHSSHMLSSMLLYHYMFRPHPFYMSPFGYGMYPRYFGMGYARVHHGAYITRTRTHVRASPSTRVANRSSRVASPNRGRSAKSGIKANLRSPSRSQKSFQTRTAGPSKRSGGFGSKRAATPRASTRPSNRIGGRKRGFGRSGGFRSGGFRSRR